MQDLWRLWTSACGGPAEVHLYERLEDVPLDEVPPELRLWLDFTAVNSEIASVRWDFQLAALESLRARGVALTDVTLETMATVQARFLADSEKLRALVQRTQSRGAPRFTVHPRRSAAS
jgi:hypothetical protein